MSKYKNKWVVCKSGHDHQSTAEGKYCDQLRLLVRAREIKSYETQKTYPVVVNGVKICVHNIDFEVVNNDDKIELHEVKGKKTADWILKHKLIKALYPGIPYIIILAKNV